MASHYWLV
jgi:DNA-binding beta-propeller fold protein YncE